MPSFPNRKTSKFRAKPTKASAWDELQCVMKSVHEKNRGVSEAEVSADVQRAIAELRQAELADNLTRSD